MKPGILYLLTPIFLLFLLTGCKNTSAKKQSDNAQDTLMETVISDLNKSFEANQLAGLSVRLIHQNEEVIDYQKGMADIKRNIPVTDSTIFRIASISKTFTAIALMQLQEDGKVDLNADVSDYLGWELRNPAYPETPITLRLLMSHQSSIRDGEGYGRFTSEMFEQSLDIKELFTPDGDFFTQDMFADEAPGSYFSYTNATWGIIASVIEKVSNLTLEAYCIKYIFEPMELDARFDPSHSDPDRLAVLYRYQNNDWVGQSDEYLGKLPEPKTDQAYIPGQNGLLYGPQGGLRCSADDLEKIARLFWNNGRYQETVILEPKSLEIMTSDIWSYDGSNGNTWDDFFLSYGLGTHRITASPGKDVIFPEMKMAGHPGIAYGLLSDLYFDTASKTAVIFITNGSKKEYSYGKETTFYQPEEDVFKALTPLLTQQN